MTSANQLSVRTGGRDRADRDSGTLASVGAGQRSRAGQPDSLADQHSDMTITSQHTDPHHTGVDPTLLLARAGTHTKYPPSNKICAKQSRQRKFYTPFFLTQILPINCVRGTPVSLLLENPPTPLFETTPISDIFYV